MTIADSPPSTNRARAFSFARALTMAGLIIGVLDLADALIYYGLRGAAPHLIFQSIASGLLGHAAFTGGAGVDVLGIVLHFFIAFVVALVFLATSRRIRALADHPYISGPLYGICVWAVMYFVVLPLSASAPPKMTWPNVVDELAIHILGVGLPAALVAQRWLRGS
jgi:hypothetical protein